MSNSTNPKTTGTVLVVDDNEDNLDVLVRRLRRREYAVTSAISGEDALAKVAERSGAFDLILLDVMMPGIDGLQVLREIRKDYSPTRLPVILVTAKNHSEDIATGLRAGANDYVTKPIDFPVLFARARNHVNLAVSYRSFRAAQGFLIDAAKMESVGYLAAGVAHEIRNPLAQIQMGIEFLKSSDQNTGEREIAEIYEMVEGAVTSADAIVSKLMKLSEERRLKRERIDIADLVATCIRLLSREIEDREIEVSLSNGSFCPAEIDVAQLETALINVINNSVQAMPNGGTLRVSTKMHTVGSEDVTVDEGSRTGNEFRIGDEVVAVEIADTGPGIPEEKLATIFDPFFTSQATGKGTGLGLTVAKKIIDLHGGRIAVLNRENQGGVKVSISLPSKMGLRTTV